MTDLVAAAALLGFVGSLHCVGMCGPLLLAFAPARTPRGAALYHGARLATYALLGSAAGLAGATVTMAGLGRALSLSAGVTLLAAAGLHARALIAPPMTHAPRPQPRIGAALRGLTTRIARAILTTDDRARYAPASNLGVLSAGAANALLPCGLVYAAIGAATLGGQPARSALIMLAFGVGTLPALVAIALAGAAMPRAISARLRFAIPVTMAALGVLLVVRSVRPHTAGGHGAHAPQTIQTIQRPPDTQTTR